MAEQHTKLGWRGTTYQEWRELLHEHITEHSGRGAIEVMDAAFGKPEDGPAYEFRAKWMHEHHAMSPRMAAILIVDMAERREQAQL